MSQGHIYTPYHPRWLRRRMSTYWWLERWSYFRFILRESTCMFVAWAVAYLLVLVIALGRGRESYGRFIEWSTTPWILALNVVSLLFVTFHAITFFEAVPQATVVHLGGRRVPGSLVKLAHYVVWGALSALVAWLLLGA
jgi:succinate dehydrogenase subunit C